VTRISTPRFSVDLRAARLTGPAYEASIVNVGVNQAEAQTLPVIKTLLDRGARVDVANRQGRTPLMLANQWASHFGKPAIERLMKTAAARQ